MNKKNLVLYSYSEYGKKPEIKKKNLSFFLKKGIIPSNNIVYYFIISGHKIDKILEIELEKKKDEVNSKTNTNTFNIIKRDNIGYDFGAYSDILLNLDYNFYDYFFFINDSVRGPFFPQWTPEKNWIKIFISLFTDDIKIVGPTINYYRGTPHINSEYFVLDKVSLKLLISHNIFSKKMITNFGDVVNNCEVKMSTVILNNGYNIKCLLEAYKDIDFRIYRGHEYRDSTLNANFIHNGDPLKTNKFYDRNINIFEVIFIKANRGIDDYLYDKYMDWCLYGNKEYSNIK